MSDPYGMDDALAAVEAENPLVYTWGGIDYPCSRGDAATAKTLGFGGFAPESDLVLVVRNSSLVAGHPGLKATISVGGISYVLDQYRADPNGVFEVWSLSDPARGL